MSVGSSSATANPVEAKSGEGRKKTSSSQDQADDGDKNDAESEDEGNDNASVMSCLSNSSVKTSFKTSELKRQRNREYKQRQKEKLKELRMADTADQLDSDSDSSNDDNNSHNIDDNSSTAKEPSPILGKKRSKKAMEGASVTLKQRKSKPKKLRTKQGGAKVGGAADKVTIDQADTQVDFNDDLSDPSDVSDDMN